MDRRAQYKRVRGEKASGKQAGPCLLAERLAGRGPFEMQVVNHLPGFACASGSGFSYFSPNKIADNLGAILFAPAVSMLLNTMTVTLSAW
jgi:hypothetical protein